MAGIDSEMIERLAEAGNGGSFANAYGKKHAVRVLINTIFAMTVEDASRILAEVTEARSGLENSLKNIDTPY